MAVFLGYPSAEGHLHITSGEDVQAPPDFDPGYLQTCGFCLHSSVAFWVLADELRVTGMTTLHSWFGVTSVQGSLLVV